MATTTKTTNTTSAATTKTSTTAKSSTGSSNKKEPTKAELELELSELKKQLQEALSAATMATEALNAQKLAMTANNTVQTPVVINAPSTDVSIVYCSDSLGFASISNMELHFNRYGEEFLMTRIQFDELVGKYRKWFDEGILAVSSKNIDTAAAKGLRTEKEVGLDYPTLCSIGRMSSREIEDLWNSLDLTSQKESVVTYFKRKFIEGDENFRNREKVDLLNRLTGGGFTREQDELSGRYKINHVEL